MVAAERGHTETVALLLDRVAEVDKADRVSAVAACVEQWLMNLVE